MATVSAQVYEQVSHNLLQDLLPLRTRGKLLKFTVCAIRRDFESFYRIEQPYRKREAVPRSILTYEDIMSEDKVE